MFLLVLFPASLHEEGIRGHLAPRLVGVSFTHSDRRRLPGGAKAGGWAPAGLGFPPKSAPARAPPFARAAARARLRCRPARPWAPATQPQRTNCSGAQVEQSQRSLLTRDHHVPPGGQETPPPPPAPNSGWWKGAPPAPSKPLS